VIGQDLNIDIGDNLTTAIAGLVIALPSIIAAWNGRRATIAARNAAATAEAAAKTNEQAVESVAAQLRNNGGSSMLDKIQLSLVGIRNELRDEISHVRDDVRHIAERQTQIERLIPKRTTDHHPTDDRGTPT